MSFVLKLPICILIKYFRRVSVKRSNKDPATTCEYYSNEEVSTRGHCAFITKPGEDISVSSDRDAHDSSQIYTNTACQVSDRYTDFPCKGRETRTEAMANCSRDFEHDSVYYENGENKDLNIYESHVEEDSKNVYCGLDNNLTT